MIKQNFTNGFARVKILNKWGFVDKRGRYLIQPQYDEVRNFKENLARVKIGKLWGFVDKITK